VLNQARIAEKYPPEFHFNQANLNDFEDCARRFQLRHIERQPWPAPRLEPLDEVDAAARRGEMFHRLVQRHILDIPAPAPADPKVAAWFAAFQSALPALHLPTAIRRPEATYSIALAGKRLMARFDLVTVDPGREIVICDWKTGYPVEAAVLQARLQTAVYLTVARDALRRLYGGPIPAAALTLLYWFAEAPDQPVRIRLTDDDAYDRLHLQLARLIDRVDLFHRDARIWPLTDDLRQCTRCNYRTLCKRSVATASVSEVEPETLRTGGAAWIEEAEL